MRGRIIGALLGLLCLTACLSPANRLAKAKQIVITDPGTLAAVGAIWSVLNPCVVVDSQRTSVHTDTTRDTVTVFRNRINGDIARAEHDSGLVLYDTLCQIITRTIYSTDTTYITKTDNRAFTLVRDSLDQFRRMYYVSQGSAANWEKIADNWEHDFWIAVGAGILLLITCLALNKFL